MSKTVEEITGEIVAAYLNTDPGARFVTEKAGNFEAVGKRVADMFEIIHGSIVRSESWRRQGAKDHP